MRGVGRSCRGQGQVFVTLVRQTAQQLLARGPPSQLCALQAKEHLEQTLTLREAQRQRLTLALTTAMSHHADIRKPSTRLTQGKQLSPCTLINASALTRAPMLNGKSTCPAPFGRKPGLASEPAPGFILATLVPPGNPSDPSEGLPLRAKVPSAIDRVRTGPTPQIHSVASDLGLNDPFLRQALHARGILSGGIPKTIEPIKPQPRAQDLLTLLNEAGLHRQRTPHQVRLAWARGSSRPVGESHLASWRARGAGHVRSKGLEGAGLQPGLTVMAPNGAVLVRIRQPHMSKRSQKFRGFLGLKSPKANEIKHPKN